VFPQSLDGVVTFHLFHFLRRKITSVEQRPSACAKGRPQNLIKASASGNNYCLSAGGVRRPSEHRDHALLSRRKIKKEALQKFWGEAGAAELSGMVAVHVASSQLGLLK
jgi:hypothetical protein